MLYHFAVSTKTRCMVSGCPPCRRAGQALRRRPRAASRPNRQPDTEFLSGTGRPCKRVMEHKARATTSKSLRANGWVGVRRAALLSSFPTHIFGLSFRLLPARGPTVRPTERLLLVRSNTRKGDFACVNICWSLRWPSARVFGRTVKKTIRRK